MKVALLSLRRFEKKWVGQGIARYVAELYSGLRATGLKIQKEVLPDFKFDAMSFMIGSATKDLSGYDVIHNPIGFLHIKKGNAKYVVTIHDLHPVGGGSLKWRVWHNVFFKPGIRYAIRNADHIIAVSSQTAGELKKLGCKNISVVLEGLDDRFFKKSVKRKNKEFRVGHISSLNKNKNVEMLIDAAKMLDPKTKVELWGNAPEYYKRIIYEINRKPIPKLMGFLPDEKIIETYDSFDVFVFPSTYEGFGFQIIEAQARGVPVIIYEKGMIPKEIAKYCIKAKDAVHMAKIIERIRTQGYSAKERKRAMAYARGFTWKKAAMETLEVYKKAMR